MNGIIISWAQLLLVALLIVGFYIAEWWWFARREKRGLRHRQDSLMVAQEQMQQEIAALRRDLAELKAGDSKKVHQAGHHDEEASAYTQAIKLARQGLDPAAVAAGCGISRGEAELIIALYRSTRSP